MNALEVVRQRPRAIRALSVLAVVCLSAPGTLRATQGRFDAVPVRGNLEETPEVGRELSFKDEYRDEGYVHAYTFSGDEGDSVTLELTSPDFDTYLWLDGPGLDEPVGDDDGGDSLNSRISTSLRTRGEYRVIVASFSGAGTGRYTLRFSSRLDISAISTTVTATDREAVLNLMRETLGDFLDESKVLQVPSETVGSMRTPFWTIRGGRGQGVTINVEADSFEPMLLISGPGIADFFAYDSASDEDTPGLTFMFPMDGIYRTYLVSAFGEAGPFRVLVEESKTGDRRGEAARRAFELADVQMLAAGDSERIDFTASDARLIDNTMIRVWSIQGRAQEAITIDLTATDGDIDPLLRVYGPGLPDFVFENDDRVDQITLDSRVSFTFPTDDEYRVAAGTLSAKTSGEMQLEVTSGLSADPASSMDDLEGFLHFQRLLRLNDVDEGEILTPTWLIPGVEGETIVIDLTSEDFDPVLYVNGPGLDAQLRDDDGGEDLNSRLEFVVPESGLFRVSVSTFSWSIGEYTLTVSSN